MINRRKTRKVKVGNIEIGGDAPIVIQSMTNTLTSDIDSTVNQIMDLLDSGCEIVRIAIRDMNDAEAVKIIKERVKNVPLVADIHFDYRLAIRAIENGIDKVRINPGNIGSEERVKAVVDKAKEYNVPIRVGVNSGSLERDIVEKYGGVTSQGLIESAIKQCELMEKFGFEDIVVSIKSSDPMLSYESCIGFSKLRDYPQHIGITESGTFIKGTIKSSVGMGLILGNGVGDTIRVSLTSSPVEEIPVAQEILQCLGLRKFGVNVVSCPTCGRTRIDLVKYATQVEEIFRKSRLDITVAVMGCEVNGPGEAREADYGIAGGNGQGLIFKKGEIVKKVSEDKLVEELVKVIREDYGGIYG